MYEYQIENPDRIGIEMLRCWFLFASKLIHTSFFDQNLILSKIYLKQIFHKILLILIVSLQLYFLCIIFLYDK